MTRHQIHSIFLSAFVLVSALIAPASLPAAAQDPGRAYPTMAPVEQYLMDRDAEIALARSAAPDAISRDASVIVLTRHGYETAVEGKNGWVCWVGRGWLAMFDNPEFWNPKVRAADCLNPPAARSILPYAYKRTELLLAGHSKPEVIAAIKAAIDKKELPSLEPGTFSYMMSKGSYLTDNGGHNMPPPDVLRSSERRCSLGRKSSKLPGHGRKLLVHLRAILPTTQILPTTVRLSNRSRQMVRRNAGTEHVKTQRQTLSPAGRKIGIQESSGPDMVSAQHSILNTQRRTPCAS